MFVIRPYAFLIAESLVLLLRRHVGSYITGHDLLALIKISHGE